MALLALSAGSIEHRKCATFAGENIGRRSCMTLRAIMSILPPAQLALWPLLLGATDCGFVLYGGTAIALHLGHRQSIDFDFFSHQTLDRGALVRAMPFLKQATVVQDEPNAWAVLVASPTAIDEPITSPTTVKISFFGGLDFGRVATPDSTEDGVLRVAALKDLMATKVKVILQHIEAKDYIDLAAMLRSGESLPLALAAARALYGQAFQPSESLKAMVYFEGGDLATLNDDQRVTLITAVSLVRDLPPVARLANTLT